MSPWSTGEGAEYEIWPYHLVFFFIFSWGKIIVEYFLSNFPQGGYICVLSESFSSSSNSSSCFWTARFAKRGTLAAWVKFLSSGCDHLKQPSFVQENPFLQAWACFSIISASPPPTQSTPQGPAPPSQCRCCRNSNGILSNIFTCPFLCPLSIKTMRRTTIG